MAQDEGMGAGLELVATVSHVRQHCPQGLILITKIEREILLMLKHANRGWFLSKNPDGMPAPSDFEHTPAAFIELLGGANFGKQLAQL